MRFSRLFSQTQRSTLTESDVQSAHLLVQAGFVRQLASGIFTYLPLGLRSLRKIEQIIREEMEAIGAQELLMPVVHPADIWKETGRWQQIGAEMARFKDRADRDMVLGMTHEEIVGDLVRREIRSYRQLPQTIYQIQTKFRDEPRPRAGLIRTREFTMKDSYSLAANWEQLDLQYREHYQAYFRIFNRCGLPVIAVRSDSGMMGGRIAHEFMYLTPIGEDTLLLCDSSGYAANREVAAFQKPATPPEAPLPLEKVATPGTITVEALAGLLNIPLTRIAKTLFFVLEDSTGETPHDKLVAGVLRGDMELNETKLLNALRGKGLRRATEAEIAAAGGVAGYASPIGMYSVTVVVDDAVASSPNLVAGANEAGMHLRNTNFGRDYQAQIVTDIAAARDGDLSPDGAGPLRAVRGVEVANIFKLGTRYSDALGCTFTDQDGDQKPVIMGSYGIGIGRLLACIVEQHSAGQGLRLPLAVAPFQVHLVSLNAADTAVVEAAEAVYHDLTTHGIEVLYDDRQESTGIKLNDADLIGLPLRVIVGPRSLKTGQIELKRLDTDASMLVEPQQAVVMLECWVSDLQQIAGEMLTGVPLYQE